jgi:hypothetical protein
MPGNPSPSPRAKSATVITRAIQNTPGQNPGISVPVPQFVSNVIVKNSGAAQITLRFNQDQDEYPMEINEALPVALQLDKQQVLKFKAPVANSQVSLIFW